MGHEFHSDLISQLFDAGAAEGYALVLSGVTQHRTEVEAIHELQALRCDALILLGPTMQARDLDGIGRQTPTVTLARAVSARVGVVRTDDVASAGIATRHLIGLGHTQIIHVDGGRAPGAAERRRGYHRAMRAAGLGNLTSVVPGGLTEESGRDAARQILELDSGDRPTAAFVFNDQCAAGYLDTLRRAGVHVPVDHSVVGFDDSRVARTLWAQLTTVAQDSAALSRAAIGQAISRIRASPDLPPTLIAPELVVRDSTAPPAHRPT